MCQKLFRKYLESIGCDIPEGLDAREAEKLIKELGLHSGVERTALRLLAQGLNTQMDVTEPGDTGGNGPYHL